MTTFKPSKINIGGLRAPHRPFFLKITIQYRFCCRIYMKYFVKLPRGSPIPLKPSFVRNHHVLKDSRKGLFNKYFIPFSALTVFSVLIFLDIIGLCDSLYNLVDVWLQEPNLRLNITNLAKENITSRIIISRK